MLGLSGGSWHATGLPKCAHVVVPGGDVGAPHARGMCGHLQLCKLSSASDQQHGDASAGPRPSSCGQMEKRCCKFVYAAWLISVPQQWPFRRHRHLLAGLHPCVSDLIKIECRPLSCAPPPHPTPRPPSSHLAAAYMQKMLMQSRVLLNTSKAFHLLSGLSAFVAWMLFL